MQEVDLDRLWKAIGDADSQALADLVDDYPQFHEWRSKYGQSPLRLAVQVGSVSVIRMLLDAGADPNARLDLVSPVSGRREFGVTAVMYANTAEVVSLLVEAGANPNAIDSDGSSVFVRVGELFDARLAEALVGSGAIPSAQELERLIAMAKDELTYRKSVGQMSERTQSLESMISWCQKSQEAIS